MRAAETRERRGASGRRMRAVAVLAGVAVLALSAAPRAHHGDSSARGRRFVVETNPFLLGQAMDWLDRRHVVWHAPGGR